LLTFEQMKELIELVASHRLGAVEVERSGFRFKVEGVKAAVAAPGAASGAGAALLGVASPATLAPGAATAAGAGGEDLAVLPGTAAPPQGLPVHAGELEATAAPGAAPAAVAPTAAAAAAAAKDLHILNSPIVGTFYAAPAPDAPPFVNVGDRVRAGQVMCIIEAMKLMNEIESDVNGTVAKVFPQNAQAVEYGEPLFAIRTA
jgi:acetyl-CoA carboxylase biotin carboxyl carrier protein